MKHIFLSYSSKDARYMATMRDNLQRIGYKAWHDPQPRPDQDWRFVIDDAIRASDAIIVIVSPAAAESVYVTYEWALALGHGIPVIPVIFKAARMHPRLHSLEHFDYTAWADPNQFWDYFVREIQRMLNIAPAPQAYLQVPVSMPAPTMASPQATPVVPYTRTVMPTESGYWLVVRRGPNLNAMYRLKGDLLTLGRDQSNSISIDDPEVSRTHLRFVWQGDTYSVEDLGSTNGTRINGASRISGAIRLTGGQALMLGDTIILSYEAIP